MINHQALREDLFRIIFGTDTPAGRAFDVLLIYVICLSMAALMMESIAAVRAKYGPWLISLEWFFTILFTIEYAVRIYSSPRPSAYIRSFYGIIDLLSVLPTYLSLLIPGANFLLMVRLLRVLRIFRVLKLVRYISEGNVLIRSLYIARRKIAMFFFVVLVLATIFGTVMYVVEGPANGFSSIPKSIYWTIVTITTVGYGDIVPQTVLGQLVATMAMLTGYSIIAVPTGIVTAELASEMQRERTMVRCDNCSRTGHERDAQFCRNCGTALAGLE